MRLVARFLPGWRYLESSRKAVLEHRDCSFLWTDKRGLVVSAIAGEHSESFRLNFGPDISLDIDPSSRLISDSSPQGLPAETAQRLISDQIAPRIIAYEGNFVIHAGGFRRGERAILLAGVSGRGKSTLTLSFDQAGFELLGDDAMMISSLKGKPCATAVYPSLRLLPDSIAALLPSSVGKTPRDLLGRKQRIERPIVEQPELIPLPIQAMFIIAEASTDARVKIRSMTTAASCMALVESSFALDPSDTARARVRMEQASALARQVPTFEITYPRDYARLPEVREAILAQVAALEPA